MFLFIYTKNYLNLERLQFKDMVKLELDNIGGNTYVKKR